MTNKETTNQETQEIQEQEIDSEVLNEEIKEEDLNNKIEDLENQIKDLKNEYAKAYADTENMKKRLKADYEVLRKYRVQDFALDILPALDNLERALENKTSDESYKKGVEMIYNQIINALTKEGIEKMDVLDKPFDANFHQAIMVEKIEGVEPGLVVEVLQNGYMLKDRILRAAMVKVSE